MPTQSTALNDDTNGIKTSSYYGDRGDGTSAWYLPTRVYDGGNATQGAKADAAVTDPTSSGSIIALLKGILTRLSVGVNSLTKAEDAAHASGDAGVMALAVRRDTAAASSGTTGDYEPLQTDSTGRLRTATFDSRVGTLTNSTSTALEQTKVVKASAGTLFGIQGHVTQAGFVWICNKASAPSGTSDNLVFPVSVGTAGPFSVDFGRYGRAFSTGIAVGFSSNGTAWTAGGTAMWVDAQYE